jgi:hypothetical protein
MWSAHWKKFYQREHPPMRVSNRKTTTAGAIKGKIRAKVEANTIARMQAPIAYEGL